MFCSGVPTHLSTLAKIHVDKTISSKGRRHPRSVQGGVAGKGAVVRPLGDRTAVVVRPFIRLSVP